MHLPIQAYPLGDSAITIEWGNRVTPETNRQVWAAYHWLSKHPFKGQKDLVGAYCSLTIHYDVMEVKRFYRVSGVVQEWIMNQVSESLKGMPMQVKVEVSRLFKIPVCYGESFGSDLSAAAGLLDLEVSTLVEKHASQLYRIYMIGYLPGFVYLGTLDPCLQIPRKSAPMPMKKGSVALAGWQTGIYPSDAPGGWHCIGRTPLEMFNTAKLPPMPWKPGDEFQFVPIVKEEFDHIQKTGEWVY
jgi:inhibitor of KinA